MPVRSGVAGARCVAGGDSESGDGRSGARTAGPASRSRACLVKEVAGALPSTLALETGPILDRRAQAQLWLEHRQVRTELCLAG
jgi:hypothetical protein